MIIMIATTISATSTTVTVTTTIAITMTTIQMTKMTLTSKTTSVVASISRSLQIVHDYFYSDAEQGLASNPVPTPTTSPVVSLSPLGWLPTHLAPPNPRPEVTWRASGLICARIAWPKPSLKRKNWATTGSP